MTNMSLNFRSTEYLKLLSSKNLASFAILTPYSITFSLALKGCKQNIYDSTKPQ